MGLFAQKHGKKHIIVSFARLKREPGIFWLHIRTSRRKKVRVGALAKTPHAGERSSPVRLY